MPKKLGFSLVIALSFFGLLIYGTRPSHRLPVGHGTGLEPLPGGTQPVREDTAMPDCDSPAARRGLTGVLVRAKNARINGLSDVEQIASAADGSRSCRAVANLDFGTQSVTYNIRMLVPGGRTWELAVTGP